MAWRTYHTVKQALEQSRWRSPDGGGRNSGDRSALSCGDHNHILVAMGRAWIMDAHVRWRRCDKRKRNQKWDVMGSAAPARLARLRLGKRRPRLRFGLGRPRLRLACCLQFILTTQASSSMQNWTAEMTSDTITLTLVCNQVHMGLFSPRGGRAAGGSAGRRWFARLASEFHHMRASGVSYVPTGRPILKK